METMVATLASDGGSGQVIVEPGPLDPGRTRGFAKSRKGKTELKKITIHLYCYIVGFKMLSS